MTFLLLTGAGFSRNWGGWVAAEAFEFLLGEPDLTPSLRDRLWASEGDFEDALQRLQLDARPEAVADLRFLNQAIMRMFELMNNTMAADPIGLNFRNDIDLSVDRFLSRFDAIFTLNQDLLLEKRYRPPLGGRWSGGPAIPGTKLLDPREDIIGWRVPDMTNLTIPSRLQPYFKLHGSSRFRSDTDGGVPMLIMGGHKTEGIDREPLLRWYRDKFSDYLARSNAKLMVIGYSFGDTHINKLIETAAANGARMFVIDPQGVGVLDKRPRGAGVITPTKNTGLKTLQSAVMGASRRPLRETFGGDTAEFQKVMTFFG